MSDPLSCSCEHCITVLYFFIYPFALQNNFENKEKQGEQKSFVIFGRVRWGRKVRGGKGVDFQSETLDMPPRVPHRVTPKHTTLLYASTE